MVLLDFHFQRVARNPEDWNCGAWNEKQCQVYPISPDLAQAGWNLLLRADDTASANLHGNTALELHGCANVSQILPMQVGGYFLFNRNWSIPSVSQLGVVF